MRDEATMGGDFLSTKKKNTSFFIYPLSFACILINLVCFLAVTLSLSVHAFNANVYKRKLAAQR